MMIVRLDIQVNDARLALPFWILQLSDKFPQTPSDNARPSLSVPRHLPFYAVKRFSSCLLLVTSGTSPDYANKILLTYMKGSIGESKAQQQFYLYLDSNGLANPDSLSIGAKHATVAGYGLLVKWEE